MSQAFSMVYLYEMLVPWKAFLISEASVDILCRIIVIGFFMYDSLQRQAIGLYGSLIGITHCNGSYRNHQLRKIQSLYYLVGIVDGCTQKASSQSAILSQCTEVLSEQQRICNGIHERQFIIVTRLCATQATPFAKTVEIGTEGKNYRSGGHHRLIKMSRSQLLFHSLIASNNHTIQLHIAHSSRTACCLYQIIKQLAGHILLLVLSNSTSVFYRFYHSSIF